MRPGDAASSKLTCLREEVVPFLRQKIGKVFGGQAGVV